MREIRTLRLMRGQTIRTRADVQRMTVEHDGAPLLALGAALAGLAWWLLRWTAWTAVMTVWLLLYVPALGATVVATVGLGLLLGPLPGVLLAAVLAGAAVLACRRWRPQAWTRFVSGRVARFTRRIRYRWVFDDLMAASGLSARDASHRVATPRLGWVHLGEHLDRLTVQLCPGLTREDLAGKTDKLRSELRGLDVRVAAHPRMRGWAELAVVVSDPLAHDPATEKAPVVELARLPIGRREDGRPLTVRLRGRHVLAAGSSGAGKGSLASAILWALAPAIRDGWVRVIGIDPKGGMEFGLYPELFHMFAWQSETELVQALEAAAEMAEQRCRRLNGLTRFHRPSAQDPHYVILIDEVASVMAYIVDRKLKDRAKVALGVLLSKGRAPGYTVVGLVQDPRKEVVELRGLFTLRIALRLDSRTETGMVLGDQAYDRGARCDEISLDTPGIGYLVDEEDQRTPLRFRLDWHTDPDMRWLATAYPSPTHEDVPATLGSDTGRQEKAS